MEEIKNYVLDVDQKDSQLARQILMKLAERGAIAYDDCEKYCSRGRDVASFYIRVRPGIDFESIKKGLENAGIALL